VGGFVLSSETLCHVAPIEPARMPGRTVIPWDKDDIEALGFFKVDVLGLGMLTAVRKCLELIHADGGLRHPLERGPNEPSPNCGTVPGADRPPASRNQPLPARAGCGAVGSGETQSARDGTTESFDPLEVMTRVPAEDPAVYQMISRADTIGVFQIESRAQMAMLPRLRPARFYDLVIEVAIVRPGPIQGGMVHPYLRRRNGEEHVISPHPDLWPILERTLGVPLFQEQVMQIAIVGAGYTGGEADQLRRDMAAWKKSGRLLRHRQRLLDGFAEKGISREFGEALFEQIKGFGEYGFPESHAASFALIVYASAWQKAHYPAHFACALINAQPMGFYSPSAIIQDAQRHGVQVRDVCVSHSFWDCSLEEKALRLGLRLVKGLGEATGRRIEKARSERTWRGIDDLIRRAALRKDEVEALAEAGALEAIVPGRRQALWRGRAPRLGGLFHGLETQEPEAYLPALGKAEQLVLDYGRKGLSVDDHPMKHLRHALHQRGIITTKQVLTSRRGQAVSVAGLVTCRQQPATASGVVFITLEDETGYANLIVYRNVFEQFRHVARNSTLLLAYGHVEREQQTRTKREGTVVHVIVRELERLDRPGGGLARMSRDFH
jgi:error-prone DNA polymerase